MDWVRTFARHFRCWTPAVALGIAACLALSRRGRGRTAAPPGLSTPDRTVETDLARDYPSLDLAYDYVKPTYDLLSRRLDAVENRGRAVLTFAGTLTFAMPVFAANILGATVRRLDSPWLLVALAAFAGILVCGAFMSSSVNFLLPSVKELFDEHMDVEPAQFKINQLYYAAEDFVENTRLIARLTLTTTIAATLLLLEAAAFGAWVLVGA